MTMDEKRKLRDLGTALEDKLADMVFQSRITGADLAMQLGKSEASISCILAPAHDAAFTVKDLPVLMQLLNGEAIARIICGWLNKFPVDLPHVKPNGHRFNKEMGELHIAWDAATRDGRCSLRDAEALRKEAVDLLGVIEAWIAEKSEQG